MTTKNMNINYRLNNNEYTIRHALTWGIFQGHCQQARSHTEWRGRLVHGLIAAVELLPIIGQIVSLLELGIIRFFSDSTPHVLPLESFDNLKQTPLPSSGSTFENNDSSFQYQGIQKLELENLKNQSDDFQKIDHSNLCIWPDDLTRLGISEKEKITLDNAMLLISKLSFDSQCSGITLSKKQLKCDYKDGNESFIKELPRTLWKCEHNSTIKYILNTKVEFMLGGERKLKYSYDLLTGQYLIKKRIVGPFEEYIINEMAKKRELRGIKHQDIWRHTKSKNNDPKLQIIETMRDGSVSDMFKNKDLKDFSTKKSLIIDLLEDLNDFHNIKIDVKPTLIKNSKSTLSISDNNLEPYLAFHHDIKTANALVFKNKGRWRAELCDFGRPTSNPRTSVISIGYTPPEYVDFYKKNRPLGLKNPQSLQEKDESIRFQLKNAQGRDIWAMGMVLLSIIVGRREEFKSEKLSKSGNIAPLKCLKKCLENSIDRFYPEAKVARLKQNDLDKELDELQKEVKGLHKDEAKEVEIYFKVIKNMLQTDPSKRMSASSLVEIAKSNI